MYFVAFNGMLSLILNKNSVKMSFTNSLSHFQAEKNSLFLSRCVCQQWRVKHFTYRSFYRQKYRCRNILPGIPLEITLNISLLSGAGQTSPSQWSLPIICCPFKNIEWNTGKVYLSCSMGKILKSVNSTIKSFIFLKKLEEVMEIYKIRYKIYVLF